jgi:hypothetical protein
MGPDKEALAQAEVASRDINEDIDTSHEQAGREGYVRVVCECADVSCDRVVAITRAEYQAVRADGRRFIVARGHARSGIESVVAETDRYIVVVKDPGTPADVTEENDPRA